MPQHFPNNLFLCSHPSDETVSQDRKLAIIFAVFFFIHCPFIFHPVTKLGKLNSQISLNSLLSPLYYHFHTKGLIFSCISYFLTKSAFPASNPGHFKPNLHTISKVLFLKFKSDHVTLIHEILKVFLLIYG